MKDASRERKEAADDHGTLLARSAEAVNSEDEPQQAASLQVDNPLVVFQQDDNLLVDNPQDVHQSAVCQQEREAEVALDQWQWEDSEDQWTVLAVEVENLIREP